MSINATTLEGLKKQEVHGFVAVRLELEGGFAVNLLDGSAELSFPVNGVSTTFTGADPVFGTLAAVSAISEALANSAPRVTVSLMPPTYAAIGEINRIRNQGGLVYVWFGIVDPVTGDILGAPELLWLGRYDNAKTTLSEGARIVEIDSVSAFDRFFVAREGERLNGNHHKWIWPGETGLDYNVEAMADPNWGAETPKSGAPVVSGTGRSGGGGGGTVGGALMDSII